jgi:uncharacterized membrane protein
MEHEVVVTVDAPAEKVWSVLSDVESWPEWTESMAKVERLEDGPLAVGSTARVKQPRLAANVWRVTELKPNRSFTWTTKAVGITTVADHEIEELGPAMCQVTLRIRMTGGLVGVLSLLFGGLTRRYVQMEADGLKRQSELHPIE